MAAQSDRWHGIFNQQGVTDFDYKDSIEGPLGANIFWYILRYKDGETQYLNNLYKFWAMGQFKRQWIWCDYELEEGREQVPFTINRNNSKYLLNDLKSNYESRFIDILRQLTQYGIDKGQDVHVVITLFDFHHSAWSDTCTSPPCTTTWCKTGACVPNVDPDGCVPCSSIPFPTCDPVIPSPGPNGNPWYPGNNDHELAALPWGHNTDNKLSFAFFPPPLSDSESAEGKLFTKQKEYVTNICNLIKQAYDGGGTPPNNRAKAYRERVIFELMHEPPVPEESTHAGKIWAWFGGIKSHIHPQFAADGIYPKYAVQINNDGLLLQNVPSGNELTIDIVTTESDPDFEDGTWWDGNCSTANMADWVDVLDGEFDYEIPSSQVILDTDGNPNCRDDNFELGYAADVANSENYNFVHLEDYTTDANGNALRDTGALYFIAIAYDDCDPDCEP